MIPTNLNTHRDQHVRRALAPLAHIAQQREAAVIAIMHLNKNREADALNRLSGSIRFGGAARSVLLFAQDPDDPEGESGSQRILAHVKCNVAPRQRSIAYRIEQRILQLPGGPVTTSLAVRVGDTNASANDLLSNPTSATEATARGEARDFLLAELADGPIPTLQLKNQAEDAGIAWRTIERAKTQLNIRARKNDTGWHWELPNLLTHPRDGLDGIGGLEVKTAKNANSADKDKLADSDPDTELARITNKPGQEITP